MSVLLLFVARLASAILRSLEWRLEAGWRLDCWESSWRREEPESDHLLWSGCFCVTSQGLWRPDQGLIWVANDLKQKQNGTKRCPEGWVEQDCRSDSCCGLSCWNTWTHGASTVLIDNMDDGPLLVDVSKGSNKTHTHSCGRRVATSSLCTKQS